MTDNEISWKRMSFKGNKVWMATDQNKRPVVKNGKVLIKYQLNQDYEYFVHKAAIGSVDELKKKNICKEKTKKNRRPVRKVMASDNKSKGQHEENQDNFNNSIIIYTDGASSGNPGPSGIGILIKYGKHKKEISKYIGIATNNIAELEAIHTALTELKKTDIPVKIFTDSSYAYGLLKLNWRAKKNIELVDIIKKIILKFRDIDFIKVKGHDGNTGNEKADMLATTAIKSRKA